MNGRKLLLVVAIAVAVAGGAEPPGRHLVGQPIPSVVALVHTDSLSENLFPSQFCGGVLIDTGTVATVAHCVEDREAKSVDVVVGANNLCRGAPIEGERIPVRSVDVHPLRDPENQLFDVAFLTLSRPSEGDPISVAKPDDGASASAYGWGRASLHAANSCGLARVPLKLIALDRCAQALSDMSAFLHQDSGFCARPKAPRSGDTCLGDSGGPVLQERRDGSVVVVGLVSWGVGCDGSLPGVYARLD